MSGFDDKYKVHSLFIVPGPQVKTNLVFKVYYLLWESKQRNEYLETVAHDWTSIFCQCANRKRFLSARCNI